MGSGRIARDFEIVSGSSTDTPVGADFSRRNRTGKSAGATAAAFQTEQTIHDWSELLLARPLLLRVQMYRRPL